MLLIAPSHIQAQSIVTLTPLHSFSNDDGASVVSELIQGRDGNFYGTAAAGGYGFGTIFQITPAGGFTKLYTFQGGTNSSMPWGGLVQGNDGDFYGTTQGQSTFGGYTTDNGTVFRISPMGELTTLYHFGQYNLSSYNKLVQSGDGIFYGTLSGPTGGIVFQITSSGMFTVLHNFGISEDGNGPVVQVISDRDGNFYGITSNGGANVKGTFFQITSSGSFVNLYEFGNSNDAAYPDGLVLGNDGNLYGTTARGGANNTGTVFQLTPTGTYTNLCDLPSANLGGSNLLVQGSDGNFYGTTNQGGSNNAGTIFQVTPTGGYTLLYSFGMPDANGQNTEGAFPRAGLVQGNDGNFYGNTSYGGINARGTVFKMTLNTTPSEFFEGEESLSDNVYYLAFSNGNYFGYYGFLSDPHYIYHLDLGYEYVFDAADGKAGVYLYDFASSTFFYTSPTFPFPYLYDFSLNTILYYYPDPEEAGRYNANGVRYFYDFATGEVITK